MRRTVVFAILPLFFAACAKGPDASEPEKKQSVEDVIPITMANMRGHKALYDEGWFVVTSSKKAFAFAKEKSVVRSGEAIDEAQKHIRRHAKEYGEAMTDNVEDSLTTGKEVFETGTETTADILTATHELGKAQVDFADRTFQKAWERFVKGNLSLGKRTETERSELANTFGTYSDKLGEDFSGIYDVAAEMNSGFGERIATVWDDAIEEAGNDFEQEYEESGENPNTLLALVDILQGYAKSFYSGLVKPTAKTVADGVTTGGENAGRALFIPVAAAISVTGRTVESVGLTLYYTTSLGVKIVSPTVEAGFLSGLSILSLGTTPVTYVTGASVGAVNQVAMTAAAPVAATGQAVGSTALDTTKFVAFVAYDAVKGTTKVVFNQAASGVVLGYNALTAIPTHMVMGVADAAFFLAWDGPNLVLAVAEGRVDGFSASELPVGSVVDLNALEKEKDMKLKVISSDPALLKRVLEAMPEDVRVKYE